MALFNKEAGEEGEGEEVIEEGEEVIKEGEEEDLTKLSGKEKGKRMAAEASKKKGSYQDPDAIGNYASKRGRYIKMAERLGLADPDLRKKPIRNQVMIGKNGRVKRTAAGLAL